MSKKVAITLAVAGLLLVSLLVTAAFPGDPGGGGGVGKPLPADG